MEDSIYNKSLADYMKEKRAFHLSRIEFHKSALKEVDRYFTGEKSVAKDRSSVNTPDTHVQNLNWKKFCIDTINNEDKLMTARNIYTMHAPHETDRLKLVTGVNGVSKILSELAAMGELMKIKKENKTARSYYYGTSRMFKDSRPIKDFFE